jgi:hypothetical protein
LFNSSAWDSLELKTNTTFDEIEDFVGKRD